MESPSTERQIEQFATQYPFTLDRFQIEAIEYFLAGDSVMVAAPTGTGKTVVAEFGIYEGLRRRGRVFYTTPIKALSNQKFRDLRERYGGDVGLLTGDISENSEGQVVVMTTEVLRNMLLQTPWELNAVDVIIFDEIHYLADPERGTTWEEAIILCPEHIQLVCLSATVSNAAEIAAWIGRTHRPVRLVIHHERAVPLALSYFLDGTLHLVLDHEGKQVASFPHVGGEIRRRGRHAHAAERAEPHPNDIVKALHAGDLLPAIYFLFSRRDCENYAELCANLRLDFVASGTARAEIEQLLEAHLGQMAPENRRLGQVQLVARLARRGLGFHHAGLLPILKQLVEQLFGRGLMQVVFATDTLALGVNMPARSVVVGRMSKWDGQRRRALIPNEFQQMTGRAGRRGMDEFGYVVAPYSPYISFDETMAIAIGPLHPVLSAFKVRYNTVLNLWDPPRGDRVHRVLSQSLAQFQGARRLRDLEDELLTLQARAAGQPRGCLIGYDDGDALLAHYTLLSRSIEAARDKEQSLQRDLARLRLEVETAPWQEPGRQALRNAFRTLAPGSLVHLRDDGWAAFLGRGALDGVGLFLPLDGAPELPTPVLRVQEYRQIDYLTPRGAWVEVPAALYTLQRALTDVTSLISGADLQRIRAERDALTLPDLTAWAARHRQARTAELAGERERLDRTVVETREQLAELATKRDSHACHGCPVRKVHRANARDGERLEREYVELEARLNREARVEEERTRALIANIARVLHRFHYLHQGQPTPKADVLAGIYDSNGLLLAELLDRGLLDDLGAVDIAEVCSWFAFDREFRLANRYQLPEHLILLRSRIDEVQRDVLVAERHNELFITTGYNESFFGPLRAWCGGAMMARLTESIELSEGDLVLTINKTLDLMRQVRSMLATVMPHHRLRQTLAAAERFALRDIVAQSYTFGVVPQSPDTSDAEALDLAAGETSIEEEPADAATRA